MASKSHHPAVLSVLFGLALALASVLGPATAQATTCAQSSYTLNTQSSVDVLGNTGCTAVLGDLTITGSGITSLATLSNITSIGGDLNVSSNLNLGTLAGLDGLTSVTGAVTVSLNFSLGHLCGLQNLTTIGGDLTVANNSGSSALNCTWALQTVGGNIAFETNTWAYELDYLRSLTNHSGSLVISDTPGLLYFGTEEPYELVSVGGDLVLRYNNGIIGFAELLNLRSVGGDLKILSNPNLQYLDKLESLASVAKHLVIESNATLGDCLSIAPLLGYPNGPDNVGGTVTIGSNQTGCNSVAEIFAEVQPPGQPTITDIVVGDGRITLIASETQEGSFPVTGFRASCTDAQNNSFTGTGAGPSVMVSGLTNGTEYTCTVVALSNGGESQPSGASIPVTPKEGPDPAVFFLILKSSAYEEEDPAGLYECYNDSRYKGYCPNDGSAFGSRGGGFGYGQTRTFTVPRNSFLSVPVRSASRSECFAIKYRVSDWQGLSGGGARQSAWLSEQPALGADWQYCWRHGTLNETRSTDIGGWCWWPYEYAPDLDFQINFGVQSSAFYWDMAFWTGLASFDSVDIEVSQEAFRCGSRSLIEEGGQQFHNGAGD